MISDLIKVQLWKPSILITTIIIIIIFFIQFTFQQIIQKQEYFLNAIFIYVSQVQGVSPPLIICALDNGQIAQIDITNNQAFQNSSQLQTHPTIIQKPIMIKKKVNQTVGFTDFLISNATHFQHIRFTLGSFTSNKLIKIKSQILQMEFGLNEFLISLSNNYIILLKNNYIFEKRLYSNQITKIKYNSLNQSFLVGNNIGELSYYNHILPSQSNLLGFWNFQQVIGSQVFDVSGNNKHGRFLTGGSVSNYQKQRGQQGLFQYYKDNMDIPNLDNPQTSFSISMWFLKQNLSLSKTRLIADDLNNAGFWISICENNTGDISFAVRNCTNSPWMISSPSKFKENQVNHLVAIHDFQNSKIQIYLNGTLIIEQLTNGFLAGVDPGPLTVGSQWMGSFSHQIGFDGTIDELMMYDKALTPSQIQQLFERKPKVLFHADSKITSINLPSIPTSSNYLNVDIGTSSGSIYQLNYNITAFTFNQLSINKNLSSSVEQFVNCIQTDPNMTVFSSDSGQIFQAQKFINEIQFYDSKTITRNGNRLFIVQGLNSTIYTIQLGTSNIIHWDLNNNVVCDETCSTCSIWKNQTACISCKYYLSLMNLQGSSSSCVQKCGSQYNRINGVCISRSSILCTSSTFMSSIMSLPSVRIAVKFLYPLFVFLEDIWFYKYHNKNYSTFIQNVFQETQRINQAIVIPDFISVELIDYQINLTSALTTQSYQKRVRIQYKYIQILNPGWMFNCLTIVFWETAKAVLGLIIFYLSAKLLTYFFDKQKKLKLVIQFLFNKGTFAAFLVSLIDTNLISLTFYSFLQFQMFYYQNLNEKINIIACVFCLFAMLIYAMSFYFIVLEYSTKSVGQSILNYTEWSSSSFFQACYLYTIKHFLNGSIHALLFDYYILQNVLLASVNFFQLIVVLRFRKCFQFKISLFFLSTYYIAFTLFDILLILQHLEVQKIIVDQTDYYCQIVLVLLLCISTVFLLIVEAFGPIYIWVQQKFFKNKVQDQPKTKSILNDKYQNQLEKNSINIFSTKINQKQNQFISEQLNHEKIPKKSQNIKFKRGHIKQPNKSQLQNNQINFRKRGVLQNEFKQELEKIKQKRKNQIENSPTLQQNQTKQANKKKQIKNQKQLKSFNLYKQFKQDQQKNRKIWQHYTYINQVNMLKIKDNNQKKQVQKKISQGKMKQLYQKYWANKQPNQKEQKKLKVNTSISIKKNNKVKSNYDEKKSNILKSGLNVKYL